MLEKLNIFARWRKKERKGPAGDLADLFRMKYQRFKELLESNSELSKIIADIELKLQGHDIFGMSYIRSYTARAVFHTLRMVNCLNALSGLKYPAILEAVERINASIKDEIDTKQDNPLTEWILPYSKITKEMVDWVGGKSANLGEVLNRVNLPIPEGFAITTRAFHHFMTSNDLIDEINRKKMEIDPNDPETVNYVSEEIQRLIISAPMPRDLAEAVLAAYDEMAERLGREASGDSPPQISMRSSAIGEDSELSFAGQYLSMLNVPRERIVQTYGFITASLFTPRAIAYRLNKGIRDEDIAMSVACLRMVRSTASGIIYSRHPFNLFEDHVIITAVWGLGPYAVDGVVTPDSYLVSKDSERALIRSEISEKPVQLVTNPEGGLMEVPVPEEMRSRPCLTLEQTRLLADYAIQLEDHYGRPQDIEWALDGSGGLLVLQTRPLHLESSSQLSSLEEVPALQGYELLLQGGASAFPGVGFGPAYLVSSEDDLLGFPDGGILISKHASPKYVVVMQKAQAIVTDFGSITGHMASLCREFGVPTLLDTKSATKSILTGEPITVDAYSGRIYKGKVEELLGLQVTRESCMKDTPVYNTLKRLSDFILPLRLTDPKAPTFNAEGCRSLHDVMRLVHELSYHEMFQISDIVSEGAGCAMKLDARIPLDLYVIDLGGGLVEGAENSRKVKPAQIASIPFSALLKGMLREDLRYHHPRPVELSGFFSVMSEQMLTPAYSGAERFGDRSYAIISDKYLNFSSRIGYHYSVLDCYCGATPIKNYITFSFKGGAADGTRRNRRARAIAIVLQALDLSVEVMADRVDARAQRLDRGFIEEKLDILGRLLQFTRQMDMLMRTEDSVSLIANAFLEGNYHLENCAVEAG